MVVILQAHHGMTVQEAMDYSGELCCAAVDNFKANLSLIPSFGCAKLDTDVAAYVQGVQDWIIGSFEWSFTSQRYFGSERTGIKKHRYVELLPKRSSHS